MRKLEPYQNEINGVSDMKHKIDHRGCLQIK